MKGALLFTLLLLLVLSCKKESDDVSSKPNLPVQKGYDYFLNSNERWYYHSIDLSSDEEWFAIYRVLRDTVLDIGGEYIVGRILEERILYKYLSDEYEVIKIGIFYYNNVNRTLFRMEQQSRMDLGNFSIIDFDTDCSDPVIYSDTISTTKRNYTRYINTKNQEIIEGITLGFHDCLIAPPYPVNPSHRLLEFKYTSDEFAYNWTPFDY